MAPQLYICGDVHLVGAGGPFPRFLDSLMDQPPARLVILGDLFEYWIDCAWAVNQHHEVFQRLQQLARLGWRLDLVLGNRELAAGRHLIAASRCAVHWPVFDLTLGTRRLRIVHGDRLCHDPPYHLMAACLRGFWTRAWRLAVPVPLQRGIAGLLRRRSKQSRKSGVVRAFIDPRRLAAVGRGVDLVVAGHIHRQVSLTARGARLQLCGDWGPQGGAWLVGYADGRLIPCTGRFPT